MGTREGDPLGQVGYPQSLLFRATRLLVDSDMHARRWRREKAIDDFLTTTRIAQVRGQGEIDRHIIWVQLRGETRPKAVANWDPKEFHRVPTLGAMSLTVLERIARARWASGAASSALCALGWPARSGAMPGS